MYLKNENIVDKHRQKLTYNSAKIKYHNFLDIIATKYFSDFHTKKKINNALSVLFTFYQQK